MTAHDVLVRAREIQALGHCKFAARGEDDSRCMVASMSAAELSLRLEGEGYPPRDEGFFWAAVAELQKATGADALIRWSDAHDLPEVLAAFTKAIAATAPLVVPAEWTHDPEAALVA